MGFSLVGPDGHDNPSLGNSLACWYLGVVDKENGASTLDAVPYILCQPSNAVGEPCGPGIFIGSAYDMGVPLGFSCGGVAPLSGGPLLTLERELVSMESGFPCRPRLVGA